jgi:hypothetical protein
LSLGGAILKAQAGDELAPLASIAGPRASHQGTHTDFSDDDPIGRFMDFLAEDAIVQAQTLQPDVCTAWKRGRSASPLTGRFSVGGVELSLDRLCGLDVANPP